MDGEGSLGCALSSVAVTGVDCFGESVELHARVSRIDAIKSMKHPKKIINVEHHSRLLSFYENMYSLIYRLPSFILHVSVLCRGEQGAVFGLCLRIHRKGSLNRWNVGFVLRDRRFLVLY